MRRALEAARAQGLGREVALIHNNLAEALWPIEGPRLWLDTLREGTAFAQRRGIESAVLVLTTSTAIALADLGSYEDSLALIGDLVPRLAEAEDAFDLLHARALQASLLSRRGEPVAAAPLVDWAVQRAREMGELQFIAVAFPAAGAVRLGLGDPEGSVSVLSELGASARFRAEPYYARSLPDAVRTALGAGDRGLAARLAEGVEPTYRLHEYALVTVRAQLGEHRGEHREAEELYAEAAERWKAWEMPWERAQALLGSGRCLLALGRAVDATGPLLEARGVFDSLGAKPALAEIDALLQKATALTS